MQSVIVIRDSSDDHGTFGRLLIPGKKFSCFTIELPWRENERGLSCIPKGDYDVDIRMSPKYGLVYWVKEVPNRKWILIHPGNFAGDTLKGYKSNSKGCVLLGASRGAIGDQKVVLTSRPTVHNFMMTMNHKPFKLTIRGIV